MNVREIFPPPDGRSPNRPPSLSYEDIVKRFGEIVLDEHEDGYSGDSFYVLKRVLGRVGTALANGQDTTEWGFLVVGWGSCSGCDALQAVGSYNDLQELVDGLEASVRWFKNKNMLKVWSKQHDPKYEWYWSNKAAATIRSKLETL